MATPKQNKTNDTTMKTVHGESLSRNGNTVTHGRPATTEIVRLALQAYESIIALRSEPLGLSLLHGSDDLRHLRQTALWDCAARARPLMQRMMLETLDVSEVFALYDAMVAICAQWSTILHEYEVVAKSVLTLEDQTSQRNGRDTLCDIAIQRQKVDVLVHLWRELWLVVGPKRQKILNERNL